MIEPQELFLPLLPKGWVTYKLAQPQQASNSVQTEALPKPPFRFFLKHFTVFKAVFQCCVLNVGSWKTCRGSLGHRDLAVICLVPVALTIYSTPRDTVLLFHLPAFSPTPAGACPESVAGPHCAGGPCALLRKAALPAVAAQWAQLLWCEPGKCAPCVPRF